MQRITMRVDGTRFRLAEGADGPAVAARLVQAAQGRGEMVSVALDGDRTLDVLVTPGVSITLETAEMPDGAEPGRAEMEDDGDLHPGDGLDIDWYPMS